MVWLGFKFGIGMALAFIVGVLAVGFLVGELNPDSLERAREVARSGSALAQR